jgi:hypothetical protein
LAAVCSPDLSTPDLDLGGACKVSGGSVVSGGAAGCEGEATRSLALCVFASVVLTNERPRIFQQMILHHSIKIFLLYNEIIKLI